MGGQPMDCASMVVSGKEEVKREVVGFLNIEYCHVNKYYI